MLLAMDLRLSRHRFFIKSHSPLRSFMEKNYDAIAANPSQANLYNLPIRLITSIYEVIAVGLHAHALGRCPIERALPQLSEGIGGPF